MTDSFNHDPFDAAASNLELSEKALANKKEIYAARQSKGVKLMIAGAILGFFSCVITMTNPIPELYGIILYGLTSLAICIICLGMYFVFE
jgi:hypothetical protein